MVPHETLKWGFMLFNSLFRFDYGSGGWRFKSSQAYKRMVNNEQGISNYEVTYFVIPCSIFDIPWALSPCLHRFKSVPYLKKPKTFFDYMPNTQILKVRREASFPCKKKSVYWYPPDQLHLSSGCM